MAPDLFAEPHGRRDRRFSLGLIGNTEMYWPGFWLSVGLALLLFVIGFGFFRRMEREFADVI